MGQVKSFWQEVLYQYRSENDVPHELTQDLEDYDITFLRHHVLRLLHLEQVWSKASPHVKDYTLPMTVSPPAYDGEGGPFALTGTPFVFMATSSKLICYRLDGNSISAVATLDTGLVYPLDWEHTADGCLLYLTAPAAPRVRVLPNRTVAPVTRTVRQAVEVLLSFNSGFEETSMVLLNRFQLPGDAFCVARHSEVVAWSCVHADSDYLSIYAYHRQSKRSTTILTDIKVDHFQVRLLLRKLDSLVNNGPDSPRLRFTAPRLTVST